MDLQFRLLGIAVQVNLLFFLVVMLIRPRDDSALLAVVWVVIAFVGVLVHELGHALTVRTFGETPRIALYAMGGLTFWQPRGEMRPLKRVAVSIAGPGVGIALGAAAWMAWSAAGLRDDSTVAAVALGYFVRVNFGWGVFNLLPMLPFDGGAILAAGLEGLFGAGGRRAARLISIVVALALAALLLASGSIVGAALCAWLIYINVQALRAERAGTVAVVPLPPEPPPAPSRDAP
jgi:stage IV sporulation protein FB